MRVLIVEDTPCQSAAMARIVHSEGYECYIVANVDDAKSELLRHDIVTQLVLLDRTLGEEDDGIVLLDWMKQSGFEAVPVLIVSALKDLENRIEGLSSGAIAYVTKPFNEAELKLQIRTLLSKNVLRIGDFTWDLQKRKLTFQDQLVPLPPKRFLILSLLAINDGRSVGKRALMRKAWPDSRTVTSRYLETEISLLRKDLAHVLGDKPTIEAKHGCYRLISESLR